MKYIIILAITMSSCVIREKRCCEPCDNQLKANGSIEYNKMTQKIKNEVACKKKKEDSLFVVINKKLLKEIEENKLRTKLIEEERRQILEVNKLLKQTTDKLNNFKTNLNKIKIAHKVKRFYFNLYPFFLKGFTIPKYTPFLKIKYDGIYFKNDIYTQFRQTNE